MLFESLTSMTPFTTASPVAALKLNWPFEQAWAELFYSYDDVKGVRVRNVQILQMQIIILLMQSIVSKSQINLRDWKNRQICLFQVVFYFLSVHLRSSQ